MSPFQGRPRTARLNTPLMKAAKNVVPVAVTAGDEIEGLPQWASGRCLSADRARCIRGQKSEEEGCGGSCRSRA